MTELSPRRSDYTRLLDHAVHIPAMRDHSEQEPRRKLATPVMSGSDPEALGVTPGGPEQVAAWCIGNRYLDDHRLIGQFIVSRSRKDHGPARIRQELSQKEITRQGAGQTMRECNIGWVGLAREQVQHKYGEPLPSVFTKKVRVQ